MKKPIKSISLSFLGRKTLVFLVVVLASPIPVQTVLAATLIVSDTSNSGSHPLRNIIAAATPGDTVNFANSLSGQTIPLASGKIVLGGDGSND